MAKDRKERVMGRIAWNEGKYHRCRECKWLIGERTSVGIECMQPDNQKKWLQKEELRKSKFYPKVVARYKHPSGKACKRFEQKEGE